VVFGELGNLPLQGVDLGHCGVVARRAYKGYGIAGPIVTLGSPWMPREMRPGPEVEQWNKEKIYPADYGLFVAGCVVSRGAEQ
jgi:hypothetical protein